MDITIDKVDIIRERTGLPYSEAVEYLKSANGDPVSALVMIERDKAAKRREFMDKGGQALNRLKELVQEGNRKRLRVKRNNELLMEIPLTMGVVGAILAPKLALVGACAALATRCSISLEEDESGAEATGARTLGPEAQPKAPDIPSPA